MLQKYGLHKIKPYCIENIYNCFRSIELRRIYYQITNNLNFSNIPYKNFNYEKIYKKNCENTIGYVRIPIGLAGPIMINQNNFFVPLGTTEGALIGSINRGMSIVNNFSKNGIESVAFDTGITRSPIIDIKSIDNIEEISNFIKNEFNLLKEIFESTTRFGKLQDIQCIFNNTNIHLRFRAFTGDAMGMNIITKGCNAVLKFLKNKFTYIEVLTISGNTCCDKKLLRYKVVAIKSLCDKRERGAKP